MRVLNCLFLLFFVFIIAGCNEEFVCVDDVVAGDIILKERSKDYPWTLFKKENKESTRTKRYALAFYDCLGRSYKCESFPFANSANIGYSVVDIDKLSKDHPTYFSVKKIGQGSAQYFSYSSFDRYTEKSNMTKKVNSGFSINLGLFTLGSKRKMEEIFTTSKVQEQKRVFGELNVLIEDSCYTMQVSSNIKKKILLNYLSDDFKDELYNTTPSELFYNYGGFVLSSFMVGGSAIALYTGLYNNDEIAETKEKNMDNNISASYGYEEKTDSTGGVSGSLGIGKNYGSGITDENKITSLETSIRTIGGSLDFASFSVPQSIDNINVDLSGWIKSLNDKSTHSIVDFSDGGLLPLSDFIIEKNLREMFSQYYANGVSSIQDFQEPYIMMGKAYEDQQLIIWGSDLVTRFGDRIPLRLALVLRPNQENYLNEEIARVSNMFGLKIVQQKAYVATRSYALRDELMRFDESGMEKFLDEDGTIYLLYSENDKKFAYSIHNDRQLDEYAMREFINRLPVTHIDREKLFEYTIYAL